MKITSSFIDNVIIDLVKNILKNGQKIFKLMRKFVSHSKRFVFLNTVS